MDSQFLRFRLGPNGHDDFARVKTLFDLSTFKRIMIISPFRLSEQSQSSRSLGCS